MAETNLLLAATAPSLVDAVASASTTQQATTTRVRCVQCSLPVRGAGLRLAIQGVVQPFCCYGCYVVLRFTNEPGASGQAQGLFLRLGLAIFFSMNAMMFSLPSYFPYIYGGEFGGEGFLLLLRLGALILTIPVLLLLGLPVAWQALREAGQWTASTDALIALGTFAGFGVSVANTISGAPHVYFETIAMLLTLVAIGRYLEARGKADTGEILRQLTDAQTRQSRVERDGAVLELAATELRMGDVVRLCPGDVCPVDGNILSGQANFDEATLTGESRPQPRAPGQEVVAGATNLDGDLRILATRVGSDSTLGRLHRLVEDTLADKSGLQRLADRMASAFLPIVLAVAASTFAYWWLREGSDQAILTSLSVLVVACPCAFGIATPAALWIGIGEAGRRGILLKGADVLENIARVRKLWLDKTGTLTTGHMTFDGMVRSPSASEEEKLLQIARSLEAAVPHPIAAALTRTQGEILPVEDLRYHAGLGVVGRLERRSWFLGSSTFVQALGAKSEPWLEEALGSAAQEGAVAVVLAAEVVGALPANSIRQTIRPVRREGAASPLLTNIEDSSVETGRPRPASNGNANRQAKQVVGGSVAALAVLRFHDPLRRDAASVLARVRGLGIDVGVLTGGTAGMSSVGLDPAAWRTGLLPAEKAAWVQGSRRRGLVGMVGDGLNDAPAFAAADIGIALGTGRDLVREAANISIISNDLASVPWLITWSRRVRRTVRQNLAWATGYNALALAAAMAGWLNPIIAALAMIFSSVMILANARRLRRFA